MTKPTSIFKSPIYLSAPTRSPIGKFGGSLKNISAAKLATLTLIEAQKRRQAEHTDWVFLGHARQAGARPNPARQVTVFGLNDDSIPAITVNQACASGLTAVFHACEKIATNQGSSLWAGGVESMSNTPYYLMNARFGYRMGHQSVLDGMIQDGFHCAMADMLMGETVENFIAKEQKISREEQDEFALQSQMKAKEAWEKGLFKSETFEIQPEGKNPGLDSDEHMRPQTTIENLKKLKPVFHSNGTITAGNSSGITDGASFIHVGLQKHQTTFAEIIDYTSVALDPKKMGLGPIPAIQTLLKKQNLSISDIDDFEINEAFAAQAIACQRTLQIPLEKLNSWGGAIALGHPIGATANRILVTLLHRMKTNNKELGIASLCVSGGQGVAILVRQA
tara:strand:+ start:838 stop:2016 length:1179 start_codon:yes stop_codon:yes gene_type:complete